MYKHKSLNIVLMGLDFNSRNLGCSALGYSFLHVLEIIASEIEVPFNLVSVNYSSAEYHGNLVTMTDLPIHIKQKSFRHRFANEISKADLVFDFTGGDSFTDIYGLKRFFRESAFKQYVISKHKPLVIGPQTIGPFNKTVSKRWARSIIQKSSSVFARDRMSQEYCEKEFGIKPQLTTDVAFMLQPEEVNDYVSNVEKNIGINVSGLLWNGGYTGKNELGLSIDYSELIRNYIKHLIAASWNVWLIPHVLPYNEDSPENDYTPMMELQKEFPQVNLAPKFKTPMEAKGFISKMDFFVGSRMHATIGAFSMEVPTVSIAYSRKFQGLYNGINYPYVIDAKKSNTQEALDLLIEWTKNRELLKENVITSLQTVDKMNNSFVREIAELVKSALER